MRPIATVLAALAALALATPALAEGAPPRHGHGHNRPAADCRPHHPATHSRGSDVAMRGDRHAAAPACGRRPGPLHHLFHGRRH